MPLLAAGLGVLGGIAGAFIGGQLAIEGQERRLKSERSDAAQAVRREAYAEFIGSADEVALTLVANRPEAEIASALRRLLVTQGRVLIVAEDNVAVRDAAFNATDSLSDANDALSEADYTLPDEERQKLLSDFYGPEDDPGYIGTFLVEAQDDIEAAKE